MLNLDQIRFCAAECERQQSGEMSVYNMCHALAQFKHIWCYSHECMQELGRLVEPKKNANGYRKTPVMIGSQVLTADNILHQMHFLLAELQPNVINAGDFAQIFYQEFESIHPFIDGNGRIGAILYNHFRGSLYQPIAPPEFIK